jgi:malate dehydrogenase (oxaloacetate-decarboxylating)
MKLVTAHAGIVADSERNEEYITSSMFDPRAVPTVAAAVADTAVRTGVARKTGRN